MLAAVSFDFGHTLGFLDFELLAARAAERGLAADPARLERAYSPAQRRSEAALANGEPPELAWREMMTELLVLGSGAERRRAAEVAEWLFGEQPRRNLWRRVPPAARAMVAAWAAKVPLAIVSNSEGRLVELVEEVGLRPYFQVVVDSGVVGIAKPRPAIFELALAALGVPAERVAHVGDSYSADVAGARAAGLIPIWFAPDAPPAAPVRIARTHAEIEAHLAALSASTPAPASG